GPSGSPPGNSLSIFLPRRAFEPPTATPPAQSRNPIPRSLTMNTSRSASDRFDSLYASHLKQTKDIQARFLRSRELVDEAQQVLWLKIWQRLQSGEHITNAKAYICES